jgi:uncharacterized integral membrane protein
MRRLKYLLWLAFVIVGVLVGLWVVQDNPETITLRLLGFVVGELPLGIWVIGIFFIGAAAGLLSGSIALFGLQRKVRRYRKPGVGQAPKSGVGQPQ